VGSSAATSPNELCNDEASQLCSLKQKQIVHRVEETPKENRAMPKLSFIVMRG